MVQKFKNDKTTQIAYKIMKQMENDGLTIWEAQRTAEKVVEMLKENRAHMCESNVHRVLFELEDVILP